MAGRTGREVTDTSAAPRRGKQQGAPDTDVGIHTRKPRRAGLVMLGTFPAVVALSGAVRGVSLRVPADTVVADHERDQHPAPG